MKKLSLIVTMLFTILTLPSCEGIDGPDPPPYFADLTVHLEYSDQLCPKKRGNVIPYIIELAASRKLNFT